MFDWLKKERCSICREERSVRYCLRRNKDIGWQCCNSYRSDGKCPEACPYTPKPATSSSPLPQIKSDSRAEFIDYLQRYLHYWAFSKLTALDDRTPDELIKTEAGKALLSQWLSGFSYPDSDVLILLNNKFDLNLPIPRQIKKNPEDIAAQYLEAVIASDWDKVLSFHLQNNIPSETITHLIRKLSSHPVLRKVKKFSIINAGFTEDHKQSFVFFELNNKENWTMVFVATNAEWKLYQTINGTLQDYYVQNNLFRDIAVCLSKHDESSAYNLLKEAELRYPLCADIQYYYGQCYLLHNKTSDARQSYELATALEPFWQEPLYQAAMLYLNEKDYPEALQRFTYLNSLNPKDVNVLNNLGVCHLGLGDKDKAKAIWNNALQLDPSNELLKKNLEHFENG